MESLKLSVICCLTMQMMRTMTQLPAQPAMARRMKNIGRRSLNQKAMQRLPMLHHKVTSAHLGRRLGSLTSLSNQPHQVCTVWNPCTVTHVMYILWLSCQFHADS